MKTKLETKLSRRTFLKGAVTSAALLGGSGTAYIVKKAVAAVPDIKIGLVYPLSGAVSRNGNLCVQGDKAAMGWVNDNGGIKSLGGAKLVPVVADGGSTVEGIAGATERAGRTPGLVMIIGSWAGSLSLASTEVAERLGIPQFSISFADILHQRGFKWGFYTATPSSAYGELGLGKIIEFAKQAGEAPKTAAAFGDNQVTSKGWYETCKKYFERNGIKFLDEITWASGTLTDATPVLQKIKNLNPDIVICNPSAMAEAQMCLMKKKELDIKIPFIFAGGYVGDSSFRQIGIEYLEGVFAPTDVFPHKLTPEDWIKRSLDQCRKEYTNEPWVGQELLYGWTTIPIMAEILERAASTDPQALWKVAREIDLHDVMATRATSCQGMAFDANGRKVKKYHDLLVIQWQNGVPRTVYPPNLALSKPIWVKKR